MRAKTVRSDLVNRKILSFIKFIDSIDVGVSGKIIKDKFSLIEVRQEKVSEIKTDIEEIKLNIDYHVSEVKKDLSDKKKELTKLRRSLDKIIK